MKHPQIILVTGASSGFGRVIATQLAAQGHIVYGSSRKAVSDNPGFTMLQLDITDPASVSNAISTILKEQGSIDVLVNNAGMGISGAIELTTEEEIQRQMNTNFTGAVRMCAAVLPFMREAGHGRIINISSIAGVLAVPFQAFYQSLRLKDIVKHFTRK